SDCLVQLLAEPRVWFEQEIVTEWNGSPRGCGVAVEHVESSGGDKLAEILDSVFVPLIPEQGGARCVGIELRVNAEGKPSLQRHRQAVIESADLSTRTRQRYAEQSLGRSSLLVPLRLVVRDWALKIVADVLSAG